MTGMSRDAGDEERHENTESTRGAEAESDADT